MRYKPKNIAALHIALGGLPDKMPVEVDRSIGVSAKTVGELRKMTAWPENLAITISQARDEGPPGPFLCACPVLLVKRGPPRNALETGRPLAESQRGCSVTPRVTPAIRGQIDRPCGPQPTRASDSRIVTLGTAHNRNRPRCLCSFAKVAVRCGYATED
jgi:hypothetical protein